MTSGPITQNLANLAALELYIKNVPVLLGAPMPAIEKASSKGIKSLISQITSLQQSTASFCVEALESLNGIETMITNKEPNAQIIAAMTLTLVPANNELILANAAVSSTSGLIIQFDDYIAQISRYESVMVAYMKKMAYKYSHNVMAAAATERRYRNLATIGASVGNTAVLAANKEWKSLMNEQKSLFHRRGQNYTIASFQYACSQFQENLQYGVDTSIDCVQSALSFLAGDLSNVISDLNDASNSTLLSALVQTAITEVGTLKDDAS